ncbi:MAG: TlpA family protein disulfide reductase [Alphaproteobacteria bacterium]
MHKIILVIIALVLSGLFAFWDMNAQPTKQVKTAQSDKAQDFTKAPDVTLTDLNGKEYVLSDFQGKTVLLNFWATWCSPCVKEMPQLITLANREKDTTVFIAISVDRDTQTITDFFNRLEIDIAPDHILIAHDPKMVTPPLFETRMFPESFIIDKNGGIKHKVVGVTDWLGDDISRILSEIQ